MNVALAALQNDQIAKSVKAHPDRFAAELRRAMRSLGLRGAQI